MKLFGLSVAVACTAPPAIVYVLFPWAYSNRISVLWVVLIGISMCYLPAGLMVWAWAKDHDPVRTHGVNPSTKEQP